ncbi:FMN-dependent NADH-azoreductase [Paenibacillus selenitireducens]|uniref:FMN dependent NADH:quinone oxidoreductase n=1 Tax=Paenibacillus selenitireducens TaxID=1324314 RepID=A0A1T2XCW4_9BACL|nr:FMN-dependent NADH-azoreductase [Paenibacillus selenitireducens]OPA77721.1 FMN-dependent NADH-azoreductase [Paenibacillus selenitireducens]
MTKVLFVKANDRAAEQAVSVQLYNAFLANYKEAHPTDEVIELDLFAENLPYYNATMINGMFKLAKGFELTAEEQQAASTVNKYLDQFLAADKVVFAFPLWNMAVPAVLHTYFDYLSQAGKTFSYTAEGPVGLVTEKKVAVLSARGGVYSEGPMASREMAVNFVIYNLNLYGVKNIETVIVEGHNQFPDRSAAIVAEGMEAAAKLASTF